MIILLLTRHSVVVNVDMLKRRWAPLLDNIVLEGKTLRELADMADEVLAHLADGQAFNFSFLPALHRGMECYFEKVRSALQVVSETGYRRNFLLPVLEEVLHEAETRIMDARDHLVEIVLQLARDEASFGALRSASAPASDIKAARRLIA
ncbi:hypothetical protein LIER_40365 [Lithospermum erythrorhizon]|uniref:Uncharacterized protein n=1 Tax=Lithospermum erythrorhizon TaxID=34254 RepID=A0AAV3QZ46_LITER